MDKGIYVGMSGASSAMREMTLLTNNLANVNTTGFRGDYGVAQSYQMNSNGPQSRAYNVIKSSYSDLSPGPNFNTSRDLDIAIQGEGFIAIQSSSGKEGYTRNGNFSINKDGMLVTQSGQLVLGSAGAIHIPPAETIHIGEDGTVSARLMGGTDVVAIDKIKFTKPLPSLIQKGSDGIFYVIGDGSAAEDPTVRVKSGELEGSNVNPVFALTQLIDVSRRYEFQNNAMKKLEDNSAKNAELLQVSG